MRVRVLVTLLALSLVAACGSGGKDRATPSSASSAPGAASGTVATADSDFGKVLVDGAGMSLYAFTDDEKGESTCLDACAGTWPPVAATAKPAAPLGSAAFTSVDRPDGDAQLKVGDWPLYTFSGDARPGDVNGQGSGGAWFLVDADGELVKEKPAPDDTEGGDTTSADLLTDADGATVYVFDNDPTGKSTCNDPCSKTWPPVEGGTELRGDLPAGKVTTITRADGSEQAAFAGQPLYTFADDEAPGDTKGQGVGGVWFALRADGTRVPLDAVTVGSTDGGDVLIDGDQFTLYTFDRDTPGKSTCNDPCSKTWPAVPGATKVDKTTLDPALFTSISRDDGSEQLAFQGRPLYRFSGDENPGDANGIDAGSGLWHTVSISAKAAPGADEGYGTVPADGSTAPSGKALQDVDSKLGKVLADAEGHTLYALLDDDGKAQPTCNDGCAGTWPPVAPVSVTHGDLSLSSIERADATTQLKVGKWPAYTFTGDSAPGDVNGQGSGQVWFVIGADGKLIR